MLKYVFKRIIYMIFVFLIMSFVMFSLYNMIPGDPARAELEFQKSKLKPEVYQMMYEQKRAEMGLDDPIPVRYAKWFFNVLQGDFGMSSRFKQPVAELMSEPMKSTLFLNIFATLIALAITIPLGIVCAVKQRSKMDTVVQVGSIVGYSIPVFIICLVCIFIFSVKLRWFPISGMNTPNFQGNTIEYLFDRLYYMTLPLLVMTIGSLGGMTRYVRAAMIDSLRMDYIRTARAKGLKEKAVIYSHAWRNALLPVITLIIGWFIGIFSGSVVIESTFSLNGMGKFYIDALNNQDYNIALAVQMFYMVIALVGNLIIDLSYGLVDPRVRVNK